MLSLHGMTQGQPCVSQLVKSPYNPQRYFVVEMLSFSEPL